MELGRGERLGEPSAAWVHLQGVSAVPAGTRAVEFALLGTRNAGEDCDAYLDDLELRVDEQGVLAACITPPAYPWPEDAVTCAAPADSAEPGDSAEPDHRCGCATGRALPALALPWLALLGACRRRTTRAPLPPPVPTPPSSPPPPRPRSPGVARAGPWWRR